MKRWRVLIIILAIAVLGFILSLFNLLEFPKNILWKTANPVSKIFQKTIGKVPDFFRGIFYFRSIIHQNSGLVKENLELQSRLAKLSEVEYENEILKKEFGFLQKESNQKLIPASIIGQTSGYLKSVVIDKGEDSGIKNGSAVISQGFLVGTISYVRSGSAEVKLITDFGSLIPVVLQDSRGTGLLRGGLSGLTIEDIPLNVQSKEGEVVVTSGLGGEIPSGISVGKAGNKVSKEGEIFQKVTVNSPIDFSKLEVLFVIGD